MLKELNIKFDNNINIKKFLIPILLLILGCESVESILDPEPECASVVDYAGVCDGSAEVDECDENTTYSCP